MGVLLRWETPESDSTWDSVQVHRSDDGGTSFSQIVSQDISDNTYFDPAGDTTNIYKVRFKDDGTGEVSDFSEEITGGKINAYCSIDRVRLVSGLSTSDISDNDIFNLLDYSTAQLNEDINLRIRDEEITFIDNEKENDIDGTNTTFYIQKPRIGDLNNDGVIDENDLEVYKLDTNSNRTDLTVSSVDDAEIGKFTLSSAPASSDRVFVRYASTNLDQTTPHPLIEAACAILTSAWAFSNIEAKQIQSFKLGKYTVRKQSDGFGKMMDKYERLIDQINAENIIDTIEFDNLEQSLQRLGV